jgi:DNA-binding NarL/FixJ family response regulator
MRLLAPRRIDLNFGVSVIAADGLVLVVDDDPGFRELSRGLLESAGYRVETAAGAEEALSSLDEAAPDLVLLDIRMPQTSGYELYRMLRERNACLPIIFVSGDRVEPYDRVVGFVLGADDYLVKPFDPDELVARVRRSLIRGANESARSEQTENGDLLAELTPREREVIELLAAGRNSKQIARQLVISPRTAGTHIQNILAKLGVHSRAQAVAVAHGVQLIEPDEVEAHVAVPDPGVAA